MKKFRFLFAIFFSLGLHLLGWPNILCPAKLHAANLDAADFSAAASVPAPAEISACGYCAFLNSTAASDLDHLYDWKMADNWKMADGSWKILRSGTVGNYCYQAGGWRLEAVGAEKNAPMFFLSDDDVAQYCAWKNNNDAHSSSLQSPASSLCIDQELHASTVSFAIAAAEQSSEVGAAAAFLSRDVVGESLGFAAIVVEGAAGEFLNRAIPNEEFSDEEGSVNSNEHESKYENEHGNNGLENQTRSLTDGAGSLLNTRFGDHNEHLEHIQTATDFSNPIKMLTLDHFNEIANKSSNSWIVARGNDEDGHSLHAIKKGSIWRETADGTWKPTTIEMTPADVEDGARARKIFAQLFSEKYSPDAARNIFAKVNFYNKRDQPDAPLDGNKIREAFDYARNRLSGTELKPTNLFEQRPIRTAHVLFHEPKEVPHELIDLWTRFKQKAAAALAEDHGTAKRAETLKLYNKMSEKLVAYTENYQKTSEKLMDPLFQKYRSSEKSSYWLQARECIVANKKEEAVACKQAAERMDRFLDLRKEAQLLGEQGRRNQYEQDSINVFCAAQNLLKSVEATSLKIELMKALANEAYGSEAALLLHQEAIDKTNRAIVLFSQAAELIEQGKKINMTEVAMMYLVLQALF